MRQIASSLAKGASSTEVTCGGRWVVFAVSGSLSTETITIQASPDGGANWFTYRTDDATGTAEACTFVDADVSTGLFSRIAVGGEMRFRATLSNGAGTPSSVNVWAGGEGVKVHE